jgi:hypothetical protein
MKKKVKSKKIKTHMNFLVINSEERFENILIPNDLGQSYIDTFGLLTIRTKEEVENWLSSHNV